MSSLFFFPGHIIQSCCYCFAERSDDELCLLSHLEVTHITKQTNRPSSAAPDSNSFPSVLRQNDSDMKLISSILGADDRDTTPIWYQNSGVESASQINIRGDELPGTIISSCGHVAHRFVCFFACLCVMYASKLRYSASPLPFITTSNKQGLHTTVSKDS